MTVNLFKIGDRVITKSHGAGIVAVWELCNHRWVHAKEPLMLPTGRWGVKLDGAAKYPWYSDGVAYYYPEELTPENTKAPVGASV